MLGTASGTNCPILDLGAPARLPCTKNVSPLFMSGGKSKFEVNCSGKMTFLLSKPGFNCAIIIIPSIIYEHYMKATMLYTYVYVLHLHVDLYSPKIYAKH